MVLQQPLWCTVLIMAVRMEDRVLFKRGPTLLSGTDVLVTLLT